MDYKEWKDKWDEVSLYDMTDEMFREFVNDAFDMYEEVGFHTNYFDGHYGDSKKYTGQSFEVIRRCTTDEFDLEALPAWRIRLECGDEWEAYPEEICVLVI